MSLVADVSHLFFYVRDYKFNNILKMKNYNQSPLPFQGQKRNFLKAFKASLNEFSTQTIFVDLFGGSGLLSHTVKSELPHATVVYNDFDGFSRRIAAIPKTNILLAELRKILKDVPHK